MDNLWEDTYSDELYHFGTPGMKKGQRRYQNEDGTLTPEGKIHYGIGLGLRAAKKVGSTAVKTGKIGIHQAYRAGRDIQESSISAKERAKRRLRDAKLANQKEARRMREIRVKRANRALLKTLASLRSGKKKKESRWEWEKNDQVSVLARKTITDSAKDITRDIRKHPVKYVKKTIPGVNLLPERKRRRR